MRNHLADRIEHLKHQTLALLEQDDAFRRFRLLAQQQAGSKIGTDPYLGRKEKFIQMQVPDCLEQPPAYERDGLIAPLVRAVRGVTFERRSQLIEKVRQCAGHGGHDGSCSCISLGRIRDRPAHETGSVS